MDIMQRSDLGQEISGAAADQLISHVTGSFFPDLLSHPSFLRHLISEAAQLTLCRNTQTTGQTDIGPEIAARLPAAALQLLTELAVRSPEICLKLADDFARCVGSSL